MVLPSPSHDDLSLSDAEALDRVCSEYERERRLGKAPQIEDCVAQLPEPLQKPALRELLGIEFELRDAAGLSLDLADWQRRFPGCSEIVLDAARGRTDSAFEVWVESLATQRAKG